jgi:uncharacterized protein YaiL (DUF2058 family)
MGNLRDQLKKAKLLSNKDAKRLAHEERVKRSEVGREGIEAERKQREAELAAMREADRQRTKDVQQKHDAERAAREERAACEVLLGTARSPARGPARWYFELPDGHLPFFELRDADRRQLEAGVVCVVRSGPPGTHVYGLLDDKHAERLQAAMPGVVVWRRSA